MNTRKALAIVIGAFLALDILVINFIGYRIPFINQLSFVKDSGIHACEILRDGKSNTNSSTSVENNNDWTEPEYKKIRSMFSNSHYSDIRVPGVSLVDELWLLPKPTSEDLGTALFMAPQIMSDYSKLNGGCANHGIILPND